MPDSSLAARRRLWLVGLTLFSIACADGGASGCNGGGCGDGCGLGDPVPYPPSGPIVDQSAQVRLSRHGLAFIEDNEDGLNTLQIYSDRWAQTLDSLSTRPLIPYNRDADFDDSNRLVAEASVYSPFVRHNPDAIA